MNFDYFLLAVGQIEKCFYILSKLAACCLQMNISPACPEPSMDSLPSMSGSAFENTNVASHQSG